MGGSGVLANDPHGPSSEFLEPTELLDKNRKRILALRAAIAELENRNGGHVKLSNAYSREMLPPMDNGTVNSSQLPDIYGSQSQYTNQPQQPVSQKASYGVALPSVYTSQQSPYNNSSFMQDSVISADPLSPVTKKDIGK